MRSGVFLLDALSVFLVGRLSARSSVFWASGLAEDGLEPLGLGPADLGRGDLDSDFGGPDFRRSDIAVVTYHFGCFRLC